MSRHIGIKLLPDNSGRVRIHWFVRDPAGPIITSGRRAVTAKGPITLGGARGYIACQPDRKDVRPTAVRGILEMFFHSDDFRAATCPECLGTQEYAEVMAELEPAVTEPPAEEAVQQARKKAGGKHRH